LILPPSKTGSRSTFRFRTQCLSTQAQAHFLRSQAGQSSQPCQQRQNAFLDGSRRGNEAHMFDTPGSHEIIP
jgi:hypothetical protein